MTNPPYYNMSNLHLCTCVPLIIIPPPFQKPNRYISNESINRSSYPRPYSITRSDHISTPSIPSTPSTGMEPFQGTCIHVSSFKCKLVQSFQDLVLKSQPDISNDNDILVQYIGKRRCKVSFMLRVLRFNVDAEGVPMAEEGNSSRQHSISANGIFWVR